MPKLKNLIYIILIFTVISTIFIIYLNFKIRQNLVDDLYPNTNSYAPAELYPINQVACEDFSRIWYVSELMPRTQGRCGGNEVTACTGVNYFGYHFGEGSSLYRDNSFLGLLDDDNNVYEDNNVKIVADNGGRYGFKTNAKNYFNIISNFNCDVSQIFEDADNIIECKFYSSRSQIVDVLAWSGRESTDEIDDLRDLSRTYQLQVGLNEISFEIPQELIEDENYYLFVTFLDQHKFESDYNRRCVFYQQLQAMQLQKIKFSIIPKPTYLNKLPNEQCPIGYKEDDTANTLCIREGLSDLPCYDLPAPITVNYTYACSSSGQWIQIIFAPYDCPRNSCPDGFSCEETSGTCIASQLYNDVFGKCVISGDCPNICSNIGSVQVSCARSVCKYSNQCTVDLELIKERLKESGEYPEEPSNRIYLLIIGLLASIVIILVIYNLAKKKVKR